MPTIIVFALFFAGVYFLLLRPQQQRVRHQRELITAIGVGDQVVTAGGLIGRVVDESGDRLQLEIADGIVVEFLRLAISRKLDESEQVFYEPAADDEVGESDEDGYADDGDTVVGATGAATEPDVVPAPDVIPPEVVPADPVVAPSTVVVPAEPVVAPSNDVAPAPDNPSTPTTGATGPDGSIQEKSAPAPGQDPH